MAFRNDSGFVNKKTAYLSAVISLLLYTTVFSGCTSEFTYTVNVTNQDISTILVSVDGDEKTLNSGTSSSWELEGTSSLFFPAFMAVLVTAKYENTPEEYLIDSILITGSGDKNITINSLSDYEMH